MHVCELGVDRQKGRRQLRLAREEAPSAAAVERAGAATRVAAAVAGPSHPGGGPTGPGVRAAPAHTDTDSPPPDDGEPPLPLLGALAAHFAGCASLRAGIQTGLVGASSGSGGAGEPVMDRRAA